MDTAPGALFVLSSMATRAVLAELGPQHTARAGQAITLESVGGLDAARRVRAGEPFDVVVLSSDAIDGLLAADHLIAGSKVDLARSAVAAAVRAGAARPDISSEASFREAVLAAGMIGYSTGPSGVALAALFARWGIADRLRGRTITPPPGVPVGELVARGEIELGLQQLSELIHIPGLAVLGPLPASLQLVTTFSGAIAARARHRAAGAALLSFLAGPAATEAKRRQGMEPA